MSDLYETRCAECDARLADSESPIPAKHIYVCAWHVVTGELPNTARREAVKARIVAVRALLQKHGGVSTLSTRPLYEAP